MVIKDTSSNSIEMLYKFNSVNEFYQSAVVLTTEGNEWEFKEHLKSNSKSFRGLSNHDILKSKYAYKEGLKKLKNISDITISNVGGSSYKTKWDEFDGDDMSMDRLMEGDPALSKKYKVSGNKRGRFITVKVNITENGFVSADQMLWKTYTASKLVDTLESEGYRVKVIIVDTGTNPGSFKGKKISKYVIEITLKDFSAALNLPLMVTTISPWFFRYWIFSFMYAKWKTYSGLGQSAKIEKESDQETIIIDNGDCLSEPASLKKIKEIKTLILGKNDKNNKGRS